MTRIDPFTSDNARVDAPQFGQILRLLSEAEKESSETLQRQFGGCWRVRYKCYYGGDLEWQGGYQSPYGFHIRGRGTTPQECLLATFSGRLPDDPDLKDSGPIRHYASAGANQ